MTTTRRSLFRHPDFARLWTASTISLFGTQISQLAIPAIAVLILHVSPFEVALLGAFEFLPFLLFTLPAGVWVDRLPRRRILIGGDLGRAALLGTIPIAYALGALTIWQLYVVGFLMGVLTVFFDVADQSYLPTVVERDQLIEGNAKLQASVSTAQVVGQPLGGGAVALLSAPFAVILDAVSYLASAMLIFAIRRQERASSTTPESRVTAAELGADAPTSGPSLAAESSAGAAPSEEERAGTRQEMIDGLRFVLGHRYLRNIAAATGSSNLFSNISFGIFPVFVYVELGLTPDAVGLIGGAFGAGALVGALIASRIGERFGVGRAIVGAMLLSSTGGFGMAFAVHDTALWLIGATGFLAGIAQVVYNVNQVSLRQAITPEPLLGRMNATMRFLVWGTIPIGNVVGGLLGTFLGVRVAIWIGALGGLLPFLPILFSPVRSLKRIPDPGEAAEPA